MAFVFLVIILLLCKIVILQKIMYLKPLDLIRRKVTVWEGLVICYTHMYTYQIHNFLALHTCYEVLCTYVSKNVWQLIVLIYIDMTFKEYLKQNYFYENSYEHTHIPAGLGDVNEHAHGTLLVMNSI